MNSINYKGQTLAPSKVVCVGRNYSAHIEELNNEVPDQAVIFVKPNSAISETLISRQDEPIHYEGEISFLLIDNKLIGVGFGLDLTKRELQSKLKSKGLPWERAKAFDGAVVFSDFVEFNADIKDLKLELEINGRLVQQGGCGLMINAPEVLLAEIATFMSFDDGDILMTGTPKGVGVVSLGDEFIGRIYAGDTLLIQQAWSAK